MADLFLPDDFPAMVAALQVWVSTQLAGFVVAYGGQDAPAPVHPYATLRAISPPARIGMPDRGRTGPQPTNPDVIDKLTEYDAEWLCSVQTYQRDPSDGSDPAGLAALARASALESSLQTMDVLEQLELAGMAVVDTTQPREVPQVAGAAWERRHVFEVRLRSRVRVHSSVPWLDPATLEATLSPGTPASGQVSGSVSTP